MALAFNGTSSIVNGPKLTMGVNLSFSAWVYTAGTGTNDPAIMFRLCNDETALTLRAQLFIERNTTNRLVFVVAGGSVKQWRSTLTVPHNSWHHIAVTYSFTGDAAVPTFYVDGGLDTISSTTGTVTTYAPEPQTLHIGNLGPTLAFGHNGRMQDVCFWRRIVSQGEMISIFWGGVFAAQSTAGMGPYYTFRDAPIIDGVDRSWRGWDATLTNTTPAADNPATDRGLLEMVPMTWVSDALGFGTPLPVLSPHSSRNFEGVTTDQAKIVLPAATRPNQITYAAWIKRDGVGRPPYGVWHIISHGASGASHIFYIDTNGLGQTRFDMYTSGTSKGYVVTSPLIDLNPHHVAVTYDFGAIGNAPTIYIDGVAVTSTPTSTGTGTFNNPSVPYYIGQDPGNLHGADGKIQGVAQWRRILTAAEIATVYARGVFAADHRGLQFYIGPDGRDLSGRGWHATSLGNTTPADPLPEKFPSPEFAEPVWLAKIGDANASGGGIPYYTADRDFAGNDDNATPTTWDGALVEDPNIERSTTDTFWGYEELQQTTLKLANHDGKYSALWDKESRETPVKIWRGDARTGQRHDEFSGMIVRRAREDYHVALECANLDLAAFEEEIPQDTITTAEFGDKCPTAGETIPHIFGPIPKVTLPYVVDDIPNGNFVYLLPINTPDPAVVTLYREAPEAAGSGIFEAIGSTEYVLLGPTHPDGIPGRSIVAFIKRQEKFGGGLHTIVADIGFPYGAGAGYRSPIWIIHYIIKIMLRRQVDDLLFQSVANMGLPYDCAGMIDERKPARDYLDELLMICGGRLYFDRVWKISIDAKPTYASIHIRDGLGEGEQNLVTPRSRSVRETKDQISVYKLEHRWDYLKKEYTQVKHRPVWIKGMPKIIQSNFLRDGTTADRVLDRLAKEEQYGSEEMDGELSPEATPVRENQIARATYAGLGLAGDHYRIYKINRQIGTFPVTCRRYHPFMYDYVAAPIDGDPALGTESDYTNVVPANPSGITPLAYAVEQDQDGGWTAYALIRLTTATGDNFSYTRVDWKHSSVSSWTLGASVGALMDHTQGTVDFRISGLVTGATLDFRFVTVNKFGLASTGAVILNQLMPKDTVGPPQPTGVTATVGINKTVFIACDKSTAKDLKAYEYQIATTSDFSTGHVAFGTAPPAASVAGSTTNGFTVSHSGFGIGTWYYLRIWPIDYSGNTGPPSAAAGFIFSAPGALADFAGSYWEAEAQAADGTQTTSIILFVTAPLGDVTHLVVSYEKNEESWTSPGVVTIATAPGATHGVRIRGLAPGLYYNFRGHALNALNVAGPQSVWSGTAPGDSTAPPVPTGLGAWVSTNYVFVHCATSGADIKAIVWFITTAAGTGGALNGGGVLHGSTAGQRDNAVEWSIAAGAHLANGTTYHLYVRAQDYTGNFSAWSNSVPFTYTTHNTPDITPNAVSLVGGSFAVDGSVPCDGVWYTINYIDMPSVLTGAVLFAVGTVVVRNNAGSQVPMSLRIINVTTGTAPPSTVMIQPIVSGQDIRISIGQAVIDGAPLGGLASGTTIRVAFQLGSNVLASNTQSYWNAFMQCIQLRR